MIRKLQWDSDFFGIRIGEWDVDAGSAAATDAFDIIYAKSKLPVAGHIAGYEKGYSETKVVYGKELTQKPLANDSPIHSVHERDYDSAQLYDLAYESGKYSRFRQDKKFGTDKFEALYRQWVDNSVNGKFADDVLLFKSGERITGFVTYKIHYGFAVIGLIAVAPDVQGQGIGRKLLEVTEARLDAQNIDELRIPTQMENKAACSFYKKQGYSVIETNYITHFWKK